MSHKLHLLKLFFFISGASSLVFEVIWERQLMKIFGATSLAIGTLLTAFMAGLALGSAAGGRASSRVGRPLRVYGLLEAGVGLYALCLPWLFDRLPDLYRALPDGLREDFTLFSLTRFLIVFALLMTPTTLMGATLPMVSQWLSTREHNSRQIGLLYGINTLGACVGCFSAGFVWLPALGITATNNLFALVNLGLCALVLVAEPWLGRRSPAAHVERGEDEREDEEALAPPRTVEVAPLPAWARAITLAAVMAAGAISMSYQVLWTRAYVIVLGSSTYSFTIILVSFLIGLSSGAALISSLMHRISRPLWWLACAQLGAGLMASQTFVTLDRLPELLFWRMRAAQTVASVYMDYFLLVGLVVFLPTFLMGMTFPLAVRALVGAGAQTGRAVGRLYAVNTLGSIIGSFGAGFVLLPTLGLSGGVSLIIGLNLVAGATLALVALKTRFARRDAAVVAALGALVAVMLLVAPPVDRVKLTRGMFRAAWARELFDAKSLERDRPELLFYEDGVGATISVERRGSGVVLKSNGKAEASDGADMATQILVGLLPFVVRAAAPEVEIGQEVAAMVGYGSGVTAGGSLQWPLKRLEMIEIEAAMAPASRFFDHVNHRPLEDKRASLHIADGRNYLEFAQRQYDVIVSEPSNPWIAGVAALFTVEHFRRARRHLKPGGVFSQWVQLYEMNPENVRMILATFAAVFPHVIAFSSMPKGTDLILIGADHPITLPRDGFARAWAIPSVRAELERAGVKSGYDLYGLLFMNEQELRAFAASAATLNTDDNGALEFNTPRDIIRYEEGQRYFTERYHEQSSYGDARPHLEGWGAWDGEQVAKLARGVWVAGKHAQAEELLGAAPLAGRGPAFEAMEAVLSAQRADMRALTIKLWPVRQSALSALVVETLRDQREVQAKQALEGEQAPGRGGYTGERGLLYAHILMTRGSYKLALKQLDSLRERPEDRAIVDSVPFQLIDGFVQLKRLRYQQAWEAWRRAGEQLDPAP